MGKFDQRDGVCGMSGEKQKRKVGASKSGKRVERAKAEEAGRLVVEE